MSQSKRTNRNDGSFAYRAPRRERGQILPLALVAMSTFFCCCGFVIDMGRVYLSYQELVASTDAAALAGGAGLATSSATATSAATLYGSTSTNKNSYSNLSGVTMTTAVACVPFSALPIACSASEGIYNAIQVKQTVTVPMTFARFFGAADVPLSATATASSQGSTTPYNVALIIDTTASMGGKNSDSCTDPTNNKKYTTSIGCALVGAKILLLNTAPCYSDVSTCSGTAASSVDMIGIFTFPNGEANTMANDYSNGCGGPTINKTAGYQFPALGSTTYAPSNVTKTNPTNTAPTYQVTPFLSDYRTSDSTSTLNTSSDLTAVIGQVSGCAGMQTPGGLGTYYAGALMAAQAALLQQQAVSGRQGSQNAIILLSDGEASSTQMASTDSAGNKVSTTGYKYPSTINECQQAMDIASQITAAGTTIYTVAYGSATSGGCTTDTSGPNKGIAACTAMSKIASTDTTFYTDTPSGSTSGCKSALQPAQGLAQIFSAIAGNLGSARLIPNSVFSAT
jgi:hypothetical protein